MAHIAASTLLVGTPPGTFGRVASAEADQVPIALPAFAIDRWLYPGEGQPPRTNVDRATAERLCDEEGKRLCTELEWERACSGSEDALFAGGDDYVPGRASSDSVHQMGEIGEWTASPSTRDLAPGTTNAVVFRGAAPDVDTPEETEPLRRCASRRATRPETHSRHIGFRCCQSETNDLDVTYPEERVSSRFRDAAIAQEEQRSILRAVPSLARFADEFVPTSADSALRAVGDDLAILRGWELPTGVLRWSPTDREEIWILSGRSGDDTLLAAVFPMPDGSYRHAASAVLQGESQPLAIAFTPPERTQLQWSAAWGETGESGVIVYRNGQVLIELR